MAAVAADVVAAVPGFALSHALHCAAVASFIIIHVSHSHWPGCLLARAANVVGATSEAVGLDTSVATLVVAAEEEEEEEERADEDEESEAKEGAANKANEFDDEGVVEKAVGLTEDTTLPPVANGLVTPPDEDEEKEEEPREAQLAAAPELLLSADGEEPSDKAAGAENSEGVDEVVEVGAAPNEKEGAAALVENVNVGAENENALAG